MSCEKVIIQQLRSRGFRFTPQREIILSVLHEIEGLATAEEIYQRVQQRNSAVDISTVYRTLDFLREFDIVSSVDLEDGQRRYEFLGIRGAHLHLVCQSCGRVTGASPEVAQTFLERLQAEYGFHAALDHLSVPGLCRACAESVCSDTQD